MHPISLDRSYQTRDRRKVRIYALVDGGWPVHGAILDNCAWRVASWLGDGRCRYDVSDNSDLVEIPKPIRIAGWINIYKSGITGGIHPDRAMADERDISTLCNPRIACLPITVTGNEGDGL